jgi:hypothetical protein
MNKFTTVMVGFLLFLFIAPMLSGCVTLQDKMMEMKLSMSPWADDKPLMLDTTDCRLPTGMNCFNPGPSVPFMLGPLEYDDMLIALRDV